MEQEALKVLSAAYYDHKNLIDHQIDSYNLFIDRELQDAVDTVGQFDAHINEETDQERDIINLGVISTRNPEVREADGTIRTLYPQEARLRNLSYSAPLYLNLQIISNAGTDQEKVFKDGEVRIGEIPVMVGSDLCNLTGLSNQEQIKYGEDPQDLGGYFIIRGHERVLTATEDLVSNRILTEVQNQSGKQIQIAKAYSERSGNRYLTTIKSDSQGILRVSFPGISGYVDFVTVMYALGEQTDKDIIDHFPNDPKIITQLLRSIEECTDDNQKEALNKIGNKLAPGRDIDYRLDQCKYVLNQYLLPHLNDNRSKLDYLSRMAFACLDVSQNQRSVDDKDHYKNKRLRLAGNLIYDLFRSVLKRLGRDIQYYLKKASTRNRRRSLNTIVRPDLFTKRIETAFLTGNWVGDRSGVTQYVDRTNYVSTVSQIRQIKSPLSRSQPHFKARALHATNWGRICPSETPEGPNCGLVNYLAQGVDVTHQDADEDKIKHMINQM